MEDATGNQRNNVAGWNGIRFTMPPGWEFRVIDKRHIVLERNFNPLLQLKWEMQTRRKDIEKAQPADREQWSCSTGGSSVWPEIKKRFELITLREPGQDHLTGILFCRDCNAGIHFQLLSSDSADRRECEQVLASLTCHDIDNQASYAWTLQDTTFCLPAEMALQQYGFKAGLCWTSHRQGPTVVRACRLAPADRRLAQASAVTILQELTGEGELRQDQLCSEGTTVLYRSPPIFNQLLYRMRRRPPFIQAALRHLAGANVLAGCIISSRRPIPPAAACSLLPSL